MRARLKFGQDLHGDVAVRGPRELDPLIHYLDMLDGVPDHLAEDLAGAEAVRSGRAARWQGGLNDVDIVITPAGVRVDHAYAGVCTLSIEEFAGEVFAYLTWLRRPT